MTHARAHSSRSKADAGAPARAPTRANTPHRTRSAIGGPRVGMPQPKLRVSQPAEPMEREADVVATRVGSGVAAGEPVRLATPAGASAQRELQRAAGEEKVQRAAAEEKVQRAAAEEKVQRAAGEEKVQRAARKGPGSAPGITPRTASTIARPSSGAPLPRSVRGSIEPHLGASLVGVRVHTDADATHAATSLGARAFTVGSNIFLNRGESPLDASLMAHESTHVLQQGGGGPLAAARQPVEPEAQLLPDFITDELADYARYVPGYTLFTFIIEYDPLRGTRVERTPMTLVEGIMGLVPAGTYIFDQLRELGVLQAAFDFIEAQLATFDLSLERLERTIEQAWDEMDFKRLDPFEYNLGILAKHAERLLDDVRGFAASVVSRLMELIKEALVGVAEDLLAENKAWALIKKILHYDPLRGVPVEATTVEILEDFLRLIGKEQELEQMRARGTLQKTADWLDTQIATFMSLLTELSSLFSAAWEAIQPANLPDLPSTIPALVQRAGAFLQRVWDFSTTVAVQVIALIKDALLAWLSTFVDEVPGFNLLTVILGRNPITGAAVPRTAVNIIRGFITLLPGGNAVYERLEQTGVIADAGARIEGAISELGITWEFIVGLFKGIWDTVVSIDTLIDPIGVFIRVRDQFGEPISRLVQFIFVVLRTMFELLLAVMKFPTDLIGRIVDNAMQAYEEIKNDPIAFLLHLLEAVKVGFSNFFDHILTHLMNGLVEWLFRGLRKAGVEPPKDLSFASILDTVLQVLGISVERIWQKLAERFGQETIDKIRGAIDKVVGIWTVVKDVQERGISALWEYVESQLSNLWNTVLDAAKNWIMEQIVNKVVAKLLSMLDPTGIMAVVNSFIAFFNAVQSAIEYLRDILEIIDTWVSTIAAIARGDITPGAAKLEEGLADAIPVAIGFLANQVGLGDIATRIAEIIGNVRVVVDKALDWLLDKLAAMVNRVQAMIQGEKKGEGVTDGVRGEVRRALIEALANSPHTREQVIPIAAGIADQFRSVGVKRVVVGELNAEGGYDILVEASPLSPAVLMRLVRPGWTVAANATLRFHHAVTLQTPRVFLPPYTRERPRAPLAPEPHPSGSGVVVTGGDADLRGVQIVHPEGRPALSPTGRPREQITSDVIQVVSQNFRIEANKRQHNNHSHAEYKLVQQVMRDVPRDEWPKLASVQLNITRMPCALCCTTLQEWFHLITGASVTVNYQESHPRQIGDLVDFPTSEEDLAVLRAFPNVAMPASPAALFSTRNEASAASARAAPVK